MVAFKLFGKLLSVFIPVGKQRVAAAKFGVRLVRICVAFALFGKSEPAVRLVGAIIIICEV